MPRRINPKGDAETTVLEETPVEATEAPDVVEDDMEAPNVENDDGEDLVTDDPLEPLTLETADPDEKLWESGPSVGQALEWKQQYGKIYVTSLSLEDHVLWHTLKRGPYCDIMERIEDLNNSGQVSGSKAAMIQEELIAKACILFPETDTFEDELAGLPSLVSQQILEASGFVALDTRGL